MTRVAGVRVRPRPARDEGPRVRRDGDRRGGDRRERGGRQYSSGWARYTSSGGMAVGSEERQDAGGEGDDDTEDEDDTEDIEALTRSTALTPRSKRRVLIHPERRLNTFGIFVR